MPPRAPRWIPPRPRLCATTILAFASAPCPLPSAVTASCSRGLTFRRLCRAAADATKYATDFFDVTIGNNQTTSIPGYPASTGWDAVTGLGTPNAAQLLPDLVEAASRP